ncbi:3-keto-disaccharide hydrolase [Reichenbachiella ulvae]|uniref:DUF1080 domain-containing protein n=1 Tax=Reichenbachiella ulvae TaxID=2980104 RepID=A0ABT3CPC1_9BACT|nr:DUF1080 domain-containing protein [Reichenbachiella ulvae]MCV9385388.1 DUF1080 domain-containing protein [Reichenbachiella ulvae]
MNKEVIGLILLLCFAFSCQAPDSNTATMVDESWDNLLDPDLSQWDNYLSYQFEEGYDGSIPVDSLGNELSPIGTNKNDEYQVFRTIEKEGETLLYVTGEYYGCVISKASYRNYHFKLKVKWGEKKWTPRENLLKDTGILYHSIGPMGAEYWRSWMLSQEFQIMEGHMGDYWSQASSAIDIRAYPPEYIMSPVADVSQPFLPLGTGEEVDGYCMRSANYEHPVGEWNTLELICFEGKSLHIVNGEVVMVLQNSRYVEGGKESPLIEGKIQLQSEASEVYYKDILIRELDLLPEQYAQYFRS